MLKPHFLHSRRRPVFDAQMYAPRFIAAYRAFLAHYRCALVKLCPPGTAPLLFFGFFTLQKVDNRLQSGLCFLQAHQQGLLADLVYQLQSLRRDLA